MPGFTGDASPAATAARPAKGSPSATDTTQPPAESLEAALAAELEGGDLAASADAGQHDDLSHPAEAESTDSAQTVADDAPTEADAEDPETEEVADAAEDEPEAEESPAEQRVPLKRLNKEVARRKTAEDRVAELSAKLEELEAKVTGAETSAPEAQAAGDPELAKHLAAEAKLQRELNEVRTLRQTLRMNPESVAEKVRKVDPNADTSPEGLRDWLDDYADQQREALTEAKTKRTAVETRLSLQAEQTRQLIQREVEARSPWLADEEDPRTPMVKRVMDLPELRNHPARLKVAVALVEYEHRARLAAAKATAAGKPAPKTTPTVKPRTAPNAALAAKPGKGPNPLAAKMQQFEQSPSEAALAELLDA